MSRTYKRSGKKKLPIKVAVTGYVPNEGIVGSFFCAGVSGTMFQDETPTLGVQMQGFSIEWSQQVRRVFEILPRGAARRQNQETRYVVEPAVISVHSDLIVAAVAVGQRFYRVYQPKSSQIPSPLLECRSLINSTIPEMTAWIIGGLTIEDVGASIISGQAYLQTDVSGNCSDVIDQSKSGQV